MRQQAMGRAAYDAAFREFVGADGFSCLAGRGVVRTPGYEMGVYGALGSRSSTRRLAADLAAFARGVPANGAGLHAFVAGFPLAQPADEAEFETRLWRQLRRLDDVGDLCGWDPAVSSDPEDPQFSFSFSGLAMFVVGMHPRSSRLARRFQVSTLVFNPRAQFERLREAGHFERLRSAVREREIALQGSLNPNLADFGEQSDARQYSGRAVGSQWKCPFHHRDP